MDTKQLNEIDGKIGEVNQQLAELNKQKRGFYMTAIAEIVRELVAEVPQIDAVYLKVEEQDYYNDNYTVFQEVLLYPFIHVSERIPGIEKHEEVKQARNSRSIQTVQIFDYMANDNAMDLYDFLVEYGGSDRAKEVCGLIEKKLIEFLKKNGESLVGLLGEGTIRFGAVGAPEEGVKFKGQFYMEDHIASVHTTPRY